MESKAVINFTFFKKKKPLIVVCYSVAFSNTHMQTLTHTQRLVGSVQNQGVLYVLNSVQK